MRYHALILSIAMFILTGCLSARELKVRLIDELVIGDDESKPVQYQFKEPRHVCTDSDGNIYLVDEMFRNIKVFDHHGNFVKYIGDSGQGPGEFLDIV